MLSSEPGFELTYHDSGNTIHFSIFTMQFCHLVTKSQYQSIIQFFNPKQRNETYYTSIKNNFNILVSCFMRAVSLLLHVH